MFAPKLFTYWTYRVFAPGTVLRSTYEAFQELLAHDGRSHELMAELEALYYQGRKEDFSRIAIRYADFSVSVGNMVACLERMAPGSFVDLRDYYRKFDFYCRFLLSPPQVLTAPPFVLSLNQADPQRVGGKAANLILLKQEIGLPVPSGFVVTTNGFQYLLEYNDLRKPINSLLAELDSGDSSELTRISAELVGLIKSADLPPEIHAEMAAASAHLCSGQGVAPLLAVRSSAVSEDGECSFAGQYLTLLEVESDDLAAAYLAVLAGKYSPEALAYRIHSGLSDEETPMAVLVLEMVPAVVSGVVYTADPAGSDEDVIFVHATRGLGEDLVSGRVLPEVYTVGRADGRVMAREQLQGKRALLSDVQLARMAGLVRQVVAHFGVPQDIEWAFAPNGELLFLQTRPLEIQSRPEQEVLAPELVELEQAPLIQGGSMAAPGLACGPVWMVDADHPPEQVPAGAILVVRETLPSLVRVLDRVSGVLAELGSGAGHFATVCREFGVPLLLGLESRVRVVEQGQLLTLDAHGRRVYGGDVRSQLPQPVHLTRGHNLPYYRKLRALLDFITPLGMIDPQADDFVAGSCRSLHDVIRFSHEWAVRLMFTAGDRIGGRSRGRKKLQSKLPLDVFLVDVGGGLDEAAHSQAEVDLERVCSLPFLALWQGMTDPSVHWSDRSHFDWKTFDEVTMAGGVASSSSGQLASYAVLGAEYVNLNMRFGYHFTLVDAMCGERPGANYCQFRFAGGGGDFSGRALRILFVTEILQRSGFQVEAHGDLLDARISGLNRADMEVALVLIGRLLGATKLMDMALDSAETVVAHVEAFLAGQSHFLGDED